MAHLAKAEKGIGQQCSTAYNHQPHHLLEERPGVVHLDENEHALEVHIHQRVRVVMDWLAQGVQDHIGRHETL